MPTRFYYILFLFLICTIDLCASFSKNGIKEKQSHNSTSKHQSAKKNDFFRLTAARLIIMILVVILIGIFIYYYFIFYPILCTKEGDYDVVEHSRNTTPSPNTEMKTHV